ncbi:FAD-dependent oxidoreductase [Streptomyces zhihengii]
MDPVIVVGAGPAGLALALSSPPRTCRPWCSTRPAARTSPARPAPSSCARTPRRRPNASAAPRFVTRSPLDGLAFDAAPPGDAAAALGDAVTPAPLHVPQHALARGLREAVAAERLVKLVTDSRLDTLEQDRTGVTAHTRGPSGTWWRGSYLVGCDGARSTVRKLLGIRFPAAPRSNATRWPRCAPNCPGPGGVAAPAAAVAAGHGGGHGPAAGGRAVASGLAAAAPGDLVTPESLVARVRDTLAGWCGETPAYELLDTGVHTIHHRLARRWRVDRTFLAGDAAHLLGALGTQGVDEGLRDVGNLAWKLAHAWHHGASSVLLDSYQDERRTAVAARLRAADQSLPILRSGGGLRTYLPGAARGHDAMLTDGHLGHGPLGAPPVHTHSPLAPEPTASWAPVATRTGAPVEDVRVTAPDGTTGTLRGRLGRGCSWCWSPPAPGCGTGGTGSARGDAPAGDGGGRSSRTGRTAGDRGLSGRLRAHRAARPARRASRGRVRRGPSRRTARGRGRRARRRARGGPRRRGARTADVD